MARIPGISFFGKTRELMYLQSYISIKDNTSALVENCRQIYECTEVCVRLLTGSFEIELWGSGLMLSSYAENSVEVRGTIEQVKLVSRGNRRDSDDAGKKATNRAIKMLEDQHLVVKIISIPNAKDPDEFIKLDISSAKSRFQSLIDNSKNVVDYKSSELEKKYDLSKAEEKVLFLKNLSNIVSKIYDPIERDIYLSRICSKYGISKDAFGISVEKNFRKSEQMEFNKSKMSKNREKSSNLHIEEFLISCIIRNTDFVKHVNEFVSDDFCSDLNFRILDTIRNLSSEGKHIDIGSISREFDSMESGEISRIANLNIMDVSESRFLSLVDRFEKKRQIRNFRKFQNLDDDKVLEFLDKLKNSKK